MPLPRTANMRATSDTEHRDAEVVVRRRPGTTESTELRARSYGVRDAFFLNGARPTIGALVDRLRSLRQSRQATATGRQIHSNPLELVAGRPEGAIREAIPAM